MLRLRETFLKLFRGGLVLKILKSYICETKIERSDESAWPEIFSKFSGNRFRLSEKYKMYI